MRYSAMWFVVSLLSVGLHSSGTMRADDAALQGADDEGFELIFNGTDLTGWVGTTGAYEVRPDGVLAFREGAEGNLFTNESYGDFVVRMEFRLPPGGNNGLAIRAPLEGNPAYQGIEIQVLDDTSDKYRDLKPWQFHGSLYGLAPARQGYLRPVGEWNFQEVTVRGPHVTVRLNGTVIVDADLDDLRPLDGHDHPGRTRREGHIGLAGHGDPVEFRNLRIKRLNARTSGRPTH